MPSPTFFSRESEHVTLTSRLFANFASMPIPLVGFVSGLVFVRTHGARGFVKRAVEKRERESREFEFGYSRCAQI